jgi:hypothetical protein
MWKTGKIGKTGFWVPLTTAICDHLFDIIFFTVAAWYSELRLLMIFLSYYSRLDSVQLLIHCSTLPLQCMKQVQWTLESRTVWFSNNLKLEQKNSRKIRFETRIKIRKSNHKGGIAQHRAAHATVSQQIRTRLVECCWSVCASARPVFP